MIDLHSSQVDIKNRFQELLKLIEVTLRKKVFSLLFHVKRISSCEEEAETSVIAEPHLLIHCNCVLKN